MDKISIRFFNDKEVRAVWDEPSLKWRFSVVDIVGILNEENDYTKAGNYWRWLKRKLIKEKVEFVSSTHKLKLTAPDGKKYLTDTLDSGGIIALAKQFPNNRAMKFLDWFTYSDNTIDGQSKKKAYTFLESNLIDAKDIGTTKSLQQIHAYIFGGLYGFAGKIRTQNISKGGFKFAIARFLPETLKTIDQMPENTFNEIADKKLLSGALTDKINDRQIYMKGVDYSYYYEEDDVIVDKINLSMAVKTNKSSRVLA
ncbi:MAG: hypothetical protein LBR69_07725 [Endomicrobium sp.]|jgi:cell filamentation protein|nr:hypothetical protein [Endomicrobium sp.]